MPTYCSQTLIMQLNNALKHVSASILFVVAGSTRIHNYGLLEQQPQSQWDSERLKLWDDNVQCIETFFIKISEYIVCITQPYITTSSSFWLIQLMRSHIDSVFIKFRESLFFFFLIILWHIEVEPGNNGRRERKWHAAMVLGYIWTWDVMLAWCAPLK